MPFLPNRTFGTIVTVTNVYTYHLHTWKLEYDKLIEHSGKASTKSIYSSLLEENKITPFLTINNWRNCIIWSSTDDWLSVGNIHFPPPWLKCPNRTYDAGGGSNCDLPQLRHLRSSAFHPHRSAGVGLVDHGWYPEWQAWTSVSADRSGASSCYLSIILIPLLYLRLSIISCSID